MLFTSIAKLTPEVRRTAGAPLELPALRSSPAPLLLLFLLQAANPFFKLLTMLMEFAGGPPGMPSFASYILQRIWEVKCPVGVLRVLGGSRGFL